MELIVESILDLGLEEIPDASGRDAAGLEGSRNVRGNVDTNHRTERTSHTWPWSSC